MISPILHLVWFVEDLLSVALWQVTLVQVRVKGATPKLGCMQGAQLPYVGLSARRWLDHWVCNTWPVRCQVTFPVAECHRPLADGTKLYHLVNRSTCVQTTFPRLLHGSAPAQSWTYDLGVTSSACYHYTANPLPSHHHHHHHRQPWAQCPLVSDAILTIAAHRCLSRAAWLNIAQCPS